MGVRIINSDEAVRVSATESNLHIGNVAWSVDGTSYLKCKAGGTINADDACTADVAATTERGYLVPGVTQGTLGEGAYMVGWNKTGATLSSGDFFWATVGPIIPAVNSTGVIAAGIPVYLATSGDVSAIAIGDPVGSSITVASGGLVDIRRSNGG